MKVIILCVVVAAVLLQDAASVSPQKYEPTGLKCHVCGSPTECRTVKEATDCGPEFDCCLKVHTATYDGDTPDQNMVWGRSCTTKKKCDAESAKAKAAKVQYEHNRKVFTCCQTSSCNA